MITSSAQSSAPSASNTAQPSANSDAIKKAVEAPDTFKDTYTNKKGDVTVTIDAKVEVPAVESIPAIAVKPSAFSQEFVDKFAAYFLKGAPVFTEEKVQTKEEIQTQIVHYQQEIEQIKNSNMENKDKEIREMERRIKEAEKRYQEAPEQRARTFATLQMNKNQNGQILDVVADLGKDAAARLNVYNSISKESTYCGISFLNGGKGRYDYRMGRNELSDEIPRGMKTSREEAEKKVLQCLLDLGISDMQIDSASLATLYRDMNDYSDKEYLKTAKQCYVFSIQRLIGGVPVYNIQGSTENMTSDPTVPAPKEPEYTNVLGAERMVILVDDTGIIQFSWENPAETVSTISEHVNLKKYSEIIKRAKDNIFFKNYTDSTTKANIKITSIKLGMMRIMRKDKPGEYLLVPVWDFIGNREQIIDGKSDWLSFGDESYVTINAIDGSFINRSWGY